MGEDDGISDVNTVNAIASVSDYKERVDPVGDRENLEAVEESHDGGEEASATSDAPAEQEMAEMGNGEVKDNES